MKLTGKNIFTSVRTEGAILPADLLQRIVDGDKELQGLVPTSYHLLEGEKLNEAISRSWNRLRGAWVSFKTALEKLPAQDSATSVTRDRWLLPLLQELGYGRLLAAKALEVQGRNYPISHGYQHTPIHLVGYRVDLDKRTAGVAGAARSSPYSLVQELLNRSQEHLWAFISNGRQLRILRDNVSLTRQAYVEFDLEAMMIGEVYADFGLLWLLCHQSRVEAEKPEQCWLEKWSKTAQEQGTRALDQLRKGVEVAIATLGQGFLSHAANRNLRQKLQSGQLSTQDYYRQLLRLVYRLLFLFVAEDRGFLLDPKADVAARERYTLYYSTARLRTLAEKRWGTRHTDLFISLGLVMEKLGSSEGCLELGLPALGSLLWAETFVTDIVSCQIANVDLLEAIRALAFITDKHGRRPVDYKNLRSEELGSVYEALLELHPELNVSAGTFTLTTAAGNERKTTGSYYTPESLVQCLLDSALDPVVDEAIKKADPEAAILNLKVCDPACGSGHFLIAAAHRMAKRLATIRTGDEEPSPEATQKALRDVIGRCIYGVDVNPMAVELCKVALWMESLEPGKPLSFLEHHIQCGNSLLGATPALLRKGIPDEAFTPIEGDDKAYCTKYKKLNMEERKGQLSLLTPDLRPWDRLEDLAMSMAQVDDILDDDYAGVQRKRQQYEAMVQSTPYLFSRFWADSWCAAFVWKKTSQFPYPITEELFRRIERNPHSVDKWMRDEVERLGNQYQFFHWHLAFPDVFHVRKEESEIQSRNLEKEESFDPGWDGGFDVILGNPPWDTLSPDSKEFFAYYEPQIRSQTNAQQKSTVEKLLTNKDIKDRWTKSCHDLYSSVSFFKNSRFYRMFAPGNLGKGDFNTYRLFIELAIKLTRRKGKVAQIVPEGLYNGANCMAIRQAFFEECELTLLLGLENTSATWFSEIHKSQKFCIFSLKKHSHTTSFLTSFNIKKEDELSNTLKAGLLEMSVKMIRVFSPDALALMEVSNQEEIDIIEKMYSCWPTFGDESIGSPYRTYMAEIHMGNDRNLFSEDKDDIPLYEGRMIAQYDHRAKGYRSGRGRSAIWEDLPFGIPDKSIQPQWYILRHSIPDKVINRYLNYRIGFCDIASPTNERTLVATLIPKNNLCGHTVPTITFESGYEWAYLCWLGVANSFTMDFLARQKASLHMSYTILDSLPFPRFNENQVFCKELLPLVAKLIFVSKEMLDYQNILIEQGWGNFIEKGLQLHALNEEVRLKIISEIEVIVALKVFQLSRTELSYIMDTFPIVKRKDEQKYGHYRTKDKTLEIYDAMAEAIKTGQPYQTLLDPPPADPRMAHPPISIAEHD